MPRMTGARFIADTVQGYGLTHVFFMPYIMPRTLMELEKRGVRTVQAHSEKAAAYMADAYARVRQGPGLCMAQSVGAMNLAAGLQDAYLACSPVVALTGREWQYHQQRHAYQEVDHRQPFAAVTKYSAYVASPDQLPVYLRQAFRSAVTGTPGPTHIDLQKIDGGAIADTEADLVVVVEEEFARVPPFRPAADTDDIVKALHLLHKAKRPVIVAGGGVTTSGARSELIALAEALSVPVATALNAKAMFACDHPLAVGVPGSYSRTCANRIVCEADLVFFIGSHTGGQVTLGHRIPRQGTAVIQLDINAEELGRNYAIAVGLHGDARSTLHAMLDRATGSSDRGEWPARVRELVREWRDSVEEVAASDSLPMRPERLCRELSDHLPADSILVSDTGHAGIWSGTMIDLQHAEQTYVRCAGSLGWGLPAAIGAKCAAPDRPVICFTGDGGAWYHLTELDTARKESINPVIVVNDNHSLNQEKDGVERALGGRSEGSDKQWLFPDADFAAIARSMGCLGLTVREPAKLATALDQALADGRPALLDVKTDIQGIAPPPWEPAT